MDIERLLDFQDRTHPKIWSVRAPQIVAYSVNIASSLDLQNRKPKDFVTEGANEAFAGQAASHISNRNFLNLILNLRQQLTLKFGETLLLVSTKLMDQ